MNPFSPKLFAILFLLASLPLCGSGSEVSVDASVPSEPVRPLAFAVGGRAPDGRVLSANSRYLTLDGRPWYPVIGEFHYSRYPADEWETELLKMKAGGVTVVSTYVFWIHHEEARGRFDWTGDRDLRRFAQLCGRHGLMLWLRIGPWDHGEVRNGGFPDWLVRSEISLRSDDPRYLALARHFYDEIAHQVRGQFWSEGGPIVGVQIENEYHGGVEHMQSLRRLALEAGFDPPFFTATGWDRSPVPPTCFLPVFGGYTDEFWNGSLAPLPPNQNFFFTPIRAEDNVMGDLSPKNLAYNSQYDGFPFLTAEMGGGMAVAYHRRPIMRADDSTAAALVKIGSGANGLGFYMYHGGTNPDGQTPLQETQAGWNGFNDLEAKSYDFQAPLGEFGQVNPTYRTLKTLALFLDEFGPELAPMAPHFPAQSPVDRNDRTTPRVAVRADGGRAFIFINNYERNYPLGDKPAFQVALKLPVESLKIPKEPITIPDGAYPIWPVNLPVGGTTLRYATAQLLCRLPDPGALIFFAWPGIAPEFEFEALPRGMAIEAANARLTTGAGGVVRIDRLRAGREEAFRLVGPDGRVSVRVVVLSREDALNAWTARLAGRQRLLLSPAALWFEGNRVQVAARRPSEIAFDVFPAASGAGAAFRHAGQDGMFQHFVGAGSAPSAAPEVELTPIRRAAPSVPVRLSVIRQAAIEPGDADFGRAAEWRVAFRGLPEKSGERALLRLSYVGDAARLYAGDRLLDDNFYKGTPWEFGLWRVDAAALRSGLRLEILPLRRDAPVFLEKSSRPDFGAAEDLLRINRIEVVLEHDREAVISE